MAPVAASSRPAPTKAWVRSTNAATASRAPVSYAAAKPMLVASLPAIPAEAPSRVESDSRSAALVWLAVRQASAARVNPPHSTVIRTPSPLPGR